MRFYTQPHKCYCGIDLHARTVYARILDQHGEIKLHRNLPANPETFLQAIASYRDDIVVAVECIVPWYWLADLCTREGIPFVLGHALDMKAIHGGKANNDTIDAHKIAVLLRGGMLPQASVYPAAMRATRDLLRRRMPLMRQRAELLAPVQKTNRQYNWPEIGKKLAYQANRDGVAERFPDPAVQKSLEIDLALIDCRVGGGGARWPCLRPLDQTARAVFPQAAFLCGSPPGVIGEQDRGSDASVAPGQTPRSAGEWDTGATSDSASAWPETKRAGALSTDRADGRAVAHPPCGRSAPTPESPG